MPLWGVKLPSNYDDTVAVKRMQVVFKYSATIPSSSDISDLVFRLAFDVGAG